MEQEDRLDEIEAYLQRQMSPEAEKAFEQEITNDPVLKKEVILQALTEKAIDLAIEDEIRMMVSEVNEEALLTSEADDLQATEAALKPLWKEGWFIGAIAAVMIGIVLVIGIRNVLTPDQSQPPVTSRAIALLELPEENTQLGDLPTEDAMDKATVAFFDKMDYPEAERLLKLAAYDPVTNPAEVQYLLAYTYFKQERFVEARQIYDDFINEPGGISQLPILYQSLDKIKWDRILTFLGAKEQDQLVSALETFINSNPDPYYSKKAVELQQELRTQASD